MKVLLAISVFLLSGLASASSIDKALSEVSWEGSKITGDKHYGKVPVKSGELVFDKKNKFKSGQLVLSVADFTVEDLTGKYAKKFVKHMKSKDFFSAKKWPDAKLQIIEMKKGKAKALMTVKDRTQKVDFKYKKKKGVYMGELTFDRTQFGMTYGSGSFFKGLGDKVISDDVKVSFKIKLKE